MHAAALSLLLTAAIGAGPMRTQGLPAPGPVTYPCAITLVCTNGNSVPDPYGAFSIVVRDPANNPMAGSAVTLDFSTCPDVSFCSVQAAPGQFANCSGSTERVTAITDINGIARFNIVGGVAHVVPAPGTAGCCVLYVDGFLITDGTTRPTIAVSAFDQSGGDGLTVGDLSLWLADYFGGVYQQRDDYDRQTMCIAAVGVPDLGRWLSTYFAGYTVGCNAAGGSLCP
jgi:hypothetical protein